MDTPCPFCDVEHLTDIIDQDGDLILLRNKYNVIVGGEQYVLIESSQCDADMPDYSQEHMRKLIHFGIHHWRAMQRSKKYETVLFFKNHGSLSGGTIRHPHMQIVAFPKLNPLLTYDEQEFDGLCIDTKHGVELNLSTLPKLGFGELNIKADDDTDCATIDAIADYLQSATDFLTHHFRPSVKEISYNIFFYPLVDKLRIKVLPRFATSPFYVGYNIRFNPTNQEHLVKTIQELYFK